eukprot:GHVS01088907.1.p1 GENE.GHVS01088907.1~~GHVS01088907.1.p1  ORF type:complete len:855 (+),score=187.90 GHVS01088907.1:161-2566(+)
MDASRRVCRGTEVGPSTSSCPASFESDGKKCVQFQPVPSITQCPNGFGLSVPLAAATPPPLPAAPPHVSGFPPVRINNNMSTTKPKHHSTTQMSTHHNTIQSTATTHHQLFPSSFHSSTSSNIHSTYTTAANTPTFHMSNNNNNNSFNGSHRRRRRLQEAQKSEGIKTTTLGEAVEGKKCLRRTATDPELGCPAGYLREGNLCTQKEKSDATGTCPNGFDIMDGTDCARLLPANPVPHCEDGYRLEQNHCVKHNFVKANPSCAGSGSFDGYICREESVAVVDMRCPEHYKLDRQLNKCIRVIERDPEPFCPEGFTIEKAAKVSQKGMQGLQQRAEQHQKSGVFHVDNVCYKMAITPPEWICPPNGSLVVGVDTTASSEPLRSSSSATTQQQQKTAAESPAPKKLEPTCGVTDRLRPLRLCPSGSEASHDGQCIVKQTIQMRFECPDGFRIDPLRRQCFKNHIMPLERKCKRGELQSGRCVEVEVAPPRLTCPSAAKPDRDNRTCVTRRYAAPIISCGKKVGQLGRRPKQANGEGVCEHTVEVPVKFGCGETSTTSNGKTNKTNMKKRSAGGHPQESPTVVEMRDGKCLRERSRRPDVRCAKGYRMGFTGDCVKVETEAADFDCPRGYRLLPATDTTPTSCALVGGGGGSSNGVDGGSGGDGGSGWSGGGGSGGNNSNNGASSGGGTNNPFANQFPGGGGATIGRPFPIPVGGANNSGGSVDNAGSSTSTPGNRPWEGSNPFGPINPFTINPGSGANVEDNNALPLSDNNAVDPLGPEEEWGAVVVRTRSSRSSSRSSRSPW